MRLATNLQIPNAHSKLGLRDIVRVAEIIIDEDASFWLIQVAPSKASHCPVELELKHDRCYDLIVLEASIEDQPIERI